jgi:S1-C subfamily serine protease
MRHALAFLLLTPALAAAGPVVVVVNTAPPCEVTPKAKAPACGCPLAECTCGPLCPCPVPAAMKANAAPLWFSVRVHAGSAVGSGTPVKVEGGKTFILTNAHVVARGPTQVSVRTTDGKVYAGRVVRTSGRPDVDLALVAVDADLGAAPVAAATPAPGTGVWMWGYGGGPDVPPMKAGSVVVNRFVEPTMTATLTAVSGDSGAGVFDTRGHLVGVNCATGAGYGCHAVPLPEVRAFLGLSAPVGYVVPNPPAVVQGGCPGGSCSVPVQGRYYRR